MEAFSGVVLLDNQQRIFLIREDDKHEIGQNRWNLPGGSIDEGEAMIESARREVLEETGYLANIQSILALYEGVKGDLRWLFIIFKAFSEGKKAQPIDPSVKEGRWFSQNEILKMNQSQLVHPNIKLAYQAALSNQGLPLKTVKFVDFKKV